MRALPHSPARNGLALALVFLFYLLVLGCAMAFHEPWSDELHSWNVAKASHNIPELLHNIRYQGHPPLWTILLQWLSLFTSDFTGVQVLQYLIAAGAAGFLIFYAPFPVIVRAMTPFGYFLLYEYGVFSRNYAMMALLAFALCAWLCGSKRKVWAYYMLLLLLDNTHLLGALLALAIHLFYLIDLKERGAAARQLLTQLLAGLMVLAPVLYFLVPPGNSHLDAHFWMSHWQRQQIGLIALAPAKALLPLPAWWKYHFWNTHVLAAFKDRFLVLRPLVYLCSLGLLVPVFALLRPCRKSLVLFLANFLLVALFGIIFPLTSARYCGTIFLALMVAYWLAAPQGALGRFRLKLIVGILCVQILGSCIALSKDLRFPFSNGDQTMALLQEVPPAEAVVTDYTCFENMAAYTGRPCYCIEAGRYQRFLVWDQEMAAFAAADFPYAKGFARYFKSRQLKSAALLTCLSPARLRTRDSLLAKVFRLQLAGQKTGAIENGGDLYLYRIATR